jgi:hypothetical protein
MCDYGRNVIVAGTAITEAPFLARPFLQQFASSDFLAQNFDAISTTSVVVGGLGVIAILVGLQTKQSHDSSYKLMEKELQRRLNEQ